MKLSEAEKGPYHKMREVSELRIQYQCEYRHYLYQKNGNTHSKASITGTELHRRVSKHPDSQLTVRRENRLIPLLIFIVTLIAGLLWIFG